MGRSGAQLPTRTFGGDGTLVSAIGLGTYHLTSDRLVPHHEAVAVVRHAAEAGINLIDTAPMYGVGEAELIIREALRGIDEPRPLLMDKIGRFEKSILARLADQCYRDPALMRAQLENSLRVLGVDRLPVLLVHETDWAEWWDEPSSFKGPVLDFLAQVRSEGLVEMTGISVRKADVAAELCRTGLFDVMLFVHYYNMVWQEAGDIAVAAAADAGMGIAIGAPYRQGLLTSVDPDLAGRLARERRSSVPPGIIKRIARAQSIALDAGLSMMEMGLRWLLMDERVQSVVVGPRSVKELADNVRWAGQGALGGDVTAALAGLREFEPEEWPR